ncbi:MG2 domain-containing protein [Mucilaginibacter sp.]|uniref:MG2 domain-containing protein n=1 Tax=Mucilaginibacter sp. TaxID=1882438 RepID=UPI003B008335
MQEKLFVHTDKSVYLTGEIVWFKIYNVDVKNHLPLNTSKTVYLEILDSNNIPIIQAKVAINREGCGNGSVYLPVSASNGNYKLRAYTNWMKNFGVESYFYKTIAIINPLKSVDVAKNNITPDYDIQFFPEGGNLVNGLSSKVALKVVGRDGKGVNFNGLILNQHNDTIVKFSPLKFGMGNFIFKPDIAETYKVIVNIDKEKKKIFKELPPINKQGYIVQLKDQEKQLEITINSNLNDGRVYLFADTRNVSKYMQSSLLKDGNAKFLMDKDLLGEGISHLTVFNDERQPVCERLYFKRPTQHVFLTTNTNQKQYETRTKVSLDISANNENGKPLLSDLSLSVYQTDSLQQIDSCNIVNSIWLTSELRGNVESPNYYFDNQNKEATEATDNLMLTQGWSKFNWDAVLDSKKPAFSFLPEYAGHIVTAKLTSILTNKPKANITSYLSVPGKRVQLYVSKSDSSGKLLFNTKDLYGPEEIVVQTNEHIDSTYRIDIMSPFSENYIPSIPASFNISPDIANIILTHSIDLQVQNLYSGAKIKQFYDAKIDSSSFFGNSAVRYKLDDYTRFTTMEEVLREYVKSVEVTKQKNHFHIRVIGGKSVLHGDPLVILDGVPIFDIDKVMQIDPLKVRTLGLVNSRYFWQAAEFEGILNLGTYKSDLAGYEFDPKAVIVDYEGMQLERQFYSPAYQTNQQKVSRLPDFRNVLYWSPSIFTNVNGKTQVDFYTSDRAGNYVGLLQGTAQNGGLGYQYFKFTVKQDFNASIK